MNRVSCGRLICSLLVIWTAACAEGDGDGDPHSASDSSVDSGQDDTEASAPEEDASAPDEDASETPELDASEGDGSLDASGPALDAKVEDASMDTGAQSDGAVDAGSDSGIGSDSGPADQDLDGVPDTLDQCPNFDNRTCAHGNCSTGSCVCSAGWTGAQCSSCAANHYGAACTPCACGSHGTCDSGLTGTGACACASGFTGAACDSCAAGRFGSSCAACTCANGTCADGLSGSGMCSSCNAGYYGQNCNQACPSCGAHGTCNAGPSGNGQCTCARGFAGTLCDVDLTGTGTDGSVTFSVDTNLSSTNTGSRSCTDGGDMVSYSVSALQSGATTTSATLTTSPGAGCLNVGDEVLLINLQGTAAANSNVGQNEFLRVQAVTADTVTFTTLKTRFYGEGASNDVGLGTTSSSQRVLLQRVPNYANVTVPANISLTAQRWDGAVGGVFYVRVHDTLTVDGAITMNGLGYRGGAATTAANATGNQGETYTGFGSSASTPNQGGGGGGQGEACASYGSSAGGGGHRLAGNNGTTSCSGEGGLAYGDTTHTRMTLGSAGGSGGMDNATSDNPPGGRGGYGGGFVGVSVNTLVGGGLIQADGSEGEGDVSSVCDGNSTTSCWDFSGPGGGGAGGSVYLYRLVDNFSGGAFANGGDGGDGVDATSGEGGNGAVGYVVLAP